MGGTPRKRSRLLGGSLEHKKDPHAYIDKTEGQHAPRILLLATTSNLSFSSMFLLSVLTLAHEALLTGRSACVTGRASSLGMIAPDPNRVFRRAEFWRPEQCTLLEIANVLGRWKSASEWAERTEFSVVQSKRKDSLAQAATKQRYDMAQRMGVVERVALQQNVRKLPFTNAQLAASFGKSIEEFENMPISSAAVDIVYDALAESKSSLIKPEAVDARRERWITADGGLDPGALSSGLYKSRAIVTFSWLFFGKGRIYGFAVGLKLVIDSLELKEKLGAIGPYVDYLLLVGALIAAVLGMQTQMEIAAETGNYETYSADEASSRDLESADGEQYSTVFEKWANQERQQK